jgi:hypothetical protein
MLDKEKLFIVIYLDVRGIHDSDITPYIEAVASAIQYDESIAKLIIPTRDSETRVECINPVLLTEDQYKDVEDKINTLKQVVEEKLKTL